MARDDSSRRNRYGRGNRGGRQQQNQFNPQQDEGRHGGRPSGTPNWQHDYGYGGSRREFESEGFRREGPYRGGEYDRGPERGEYRGEFGEYRPTWPQPRAEQNRPETWRAQRASYGEREYGQGSGGYGEGAPDRQAEDAWGLVPNERAGPGGAMPYFGQPGYYRSNYGRLTPDRGYIIPPLYPDFMGTGVPWESHAPPQARAQGFAGRGPKGYTRSDDRIHEEICERLTHHPGIDATEIEIEVKNGEVTLMGVVHERRFKHMVEDVADAVSGVKDVRNEIKVDKSQAGFSREFSDEELGENGRERDEERKIRARRRETSDKG